MRNFMAVCTIWFFTVGFWGAAFPEFALTQDAVTIISAENEIEESFDSKDDFMNLLDSNGGEMEIRCKLWDLWKQ